MLIVDSKKPGPLQLSGIEAGPVKDPLTSLTIVEPVAHTIVGGVVSSTVTVALHVAMLPFASVTVNTTLLGPISAQSNEFGATLREPIPQASLLPLSTSAPTIDAIFDPSSCTVISWQRAIGATLSSTVTVGVQVETFPLLSTLL